eukprot:2737269-Amphidinium_carterae.1
MAERARQGVHSASFSPYIKCNPTTSHFSWRFLAVANLGIQQQILNKFNVKYYLGVAFKGVYEKVAYVLHRDRDGKVQQQSEHLKLLVEYCIILLLTSLVGIEACFFREFRQDLVPKHTVQQFRLLRACRELLRLGKLRNGDE